MDFNVVNCPPQSMFDPITQTVAMADQPKIWELSGKVGRPARGGYMLVKELKWDDKLYNAVQIQHLKQSLDALCTVCTKAAKAFPVLLLYKDNWVTHDMLKVHLKNKVQHLK
ncbi:hypothetical protein EVJ58_g5197 [Rhodofomes roseus]|uniref:Uncharacterized protein n=1 Tax=Rhodofomes roseus TaxID=34475 RepID=A0A4Y9YFM4_9APHY|nr:hypothetical protein EVJ58_g5197 [Rhodofomes roseus]